MHHPIRYPVANAFAFAFGVAMSAFDSQIKALALLMSTMDTSDPVFKVLDEKMMHYIQQKGMEEASSTAGGSDEWERVSLKSLPASSGAGGSAEKVSLKPLPASSGAGESADTISAFRGSAGPPTTIPKAYPAPYSAPANPKDPKLIEKRKEFLKDNKKAFAAMEEEAGQSTEDWLRTDWTVAAMMQPKAS